MRLSTNLEFAPFLGMERIVGAVWGKGVGGRLWGDAWVVAYVALGAARGWGVAEGFSCVPCVFCPIHNGLNGEGASDAQTGQSAGGDRCERNRFGRPSYPDNREPRKTVNRIASSGR